MLPGRYPTSKMVPRGTNSPGTRGSHDLATAPLPRRSSRGLLQGLQGLRTIQARAPYEVHRRGVNLVHERVDAQVARQVLVLLQERAGLPGGLQGQPARLLGRISGALQVGG